MLKQVTSIWQPKYEYPSLNAAGCLFILQHSYFSSQSLNGHCRQMHKILRSRKKGRLKRFAFYLHSICVSFVSLWDRFTGIRSCILGMISSIDHFVQKCVLFALCYCNKVDKLYKTYVVGREYFYLFCGCPI